MSTTLKASVVASKTPIPPMRRGAKMTWPVEAEVAAPLKVFLPWPPSAAVMSTSYLNDESLGSKTPTAPASRGA